MLPLDRTHEEYLWVFITWLKTPNLTHGEVTLVQSMLDAHQQGALELARHVAVTPAFLSTLQSAARKAMDAGLLLEWSQYASQT